MAKVSGNYSSVTRGVSQQAPADRLEGQHGEQLNMLSDPVRGLVRRNGMIVEGQTLIVTDGPTDAATKDSFSYRTFSYNDGGTDLDLIYRSRPKVGSSSNHLDGLMVFDKTPITGDGFLPVVTADDDAVLADYIDGGFSAVTAIGSYVVLAGNIVQPSFSTENEVSALSTYGVVWVRGGAYARTYTLKATKASDGTVYTVSYTTKAAAYPGTLDTSTISYSDPDYQKQINDMTYAYNAAVNQWIADASADIVPVNIAQKLIDALTAAGFTGWTRDGSHIGSTNLSHAEVTDGGDGSLLVALVSNTQAVDEVTDQHYIGKVVKVQPKSASESYFYLKAFARDGDPALSGIRPVIWRESVGVKQTPTNVFAIGVLHGDSFYLASTPTALNALILAETGDDIGVPGFIPSAAGDTTSVQAPHFFGRIITALSVFQDRLMIASDSTVNLSRPGDYFNFYRSSMLTLADDDPIEVYPLGAESDTIRQAAVYDKALQLYGDDAHYAMSGRVVQTPVAAAISTQYVIAETSAARPVSTGQYIFCLKEDTQLGATSMLQTKAGVFQDTPQLVEVSRQLRDYINGTPAEVVALSNPSVVFVRTEHFLKSVGGYPRARPWGLYVYQYMDKDDGERVLDAWSAWEWSTTLGTPIGIAATGTSDGLMVYTVAWGRNSLGVPVRAVLAMSVSARPDPTGLPYLDGMRRSLDAEANGLLTPAAVPAVRAVTFTAPGAAHSYTPVINTTDEGRFSGLEHPHYTIGDAPPEDVDPWRWTGVNGNHADYVAAYPGAYYDDLWTGVAYPAYVDLSPVYVRDFKGRAKVWGRLTLGRLRVSLLRSAGFEVQWIDHVTTKTTTHWAGSFFRLKKINAWIGRDSAEVQVRLKAKDWLPLTINAIGWEGQWFESKQ